MKYKFRAYNKEMRKMILLDPLQWPLKVLDEEENWKVMMFTGLLDRHGKEIYEGDIVVYKEGLIGSEVDYIFTVIFMHGNFILESNEDHEYNDYLGAVEHIYVIGNIYENPELIGGTQKGLDLEGLKNCK